MNEKCLNLNDYTNFLSKSTCIREDYLISLYHKVKDSKIFNKFLSKHHNPANLNTKITENTKATSQHIKYIPQKEGVNFPQNKILPSSYYKMSSADSHGKKETRDIILKQSDDNNNYKNLFNQVKSENEHLKKLLKEKEEEMEIEIDKLKDKHVNLALKYDSLEEENFSLKSKCDMKDKQFNNSTDSLNAQIISQQETLSKLSDDILKLRNSMEGLKNEKNSLLEDISHKNHSISSLEQKNLKIENEMKEYIIRTGNELSSLRENKLNLDSYKSSYFEIKNQFEILTMKFQSISDENFNLKRDLLLYEKEIKNKNELVDKLRKEIFDMSRGSQYDKLNSTENILAKPSLSNLNVNLNLNNFLKADNDYPRVEKKKSNRLEEYERNLNEFNRKDYGEQNKQSRLKEIEDLQFSLSRERERVRNK